ncbi:hypothetical protein TIFTF001_030237 [Ficus carica]|uniref:GIR1-like zinc ribbon domain-containing protein n=1 Tax=Ficus carica TaxID=3494 RepID=A0AA88DT08_FICCA|nr:hypothetical protein TIFTF001_030237 [Ficus carica]
MSQRRDHQTSSPERDMKLNRSPTPPDSPQPESQTSSAATSSSESSTSSEMSVDGSCVSSEAEQDQAMSSPDQTVMNNNRVMSTPMVLVGCPRCLMYVMLSDTNPKCPKCKSTVLLDFVNENNNKKTGT